MNAVVVAASIACVSFVATAIVHLCVCRAVPHVDRLRLLFRLLPLMLVFAAATTLALQAWVVPAVREDRVAVGVVLAAVALCVLFVGLLAFYSAVTHSVRLHIGLLLADTVGRRKDVRSIVALYDGEDATRRRVRQLVDGGYLQEDGETLRLTPKGFACAAISSGGKRLFRAGPGG
jgi:hypothetical protein